MKRFVFIVEGETEESFVNEVLALFFNSKGIYNHIQCFKIKHSNGGVSKYSHTKKDIINIVPVSRKRNHAISACFVFSSARY